MTSRVQEEPFDIGAEINLFTAENTEMGAVVSFSGTVRDVPGGLQHMLIEHYPGMTLSALQTIEAEAKARWNLGGCTIIHRFGNLKVGEQIMMVATAARHRADAFEAAEFLMDYLKSCAPFWKKEFTSNGGEWVASKAADEQALKRWSR